MTFDPASVKVTCVTLPNFPRIIVAKSHGNTSMYVDTVINFGKTTYILHITYIHTCTTYRMSDHIVSFWTQFRRDKKLLVHSGNFSILSFILCYVIVSINHHSYFRYPKSNTQFVFLSASPPPPPPHFTFWLRWVPEDNTTFSFSWHTWSSNLITGLACPSYSLALGADALWCFTGDSLLLPVI